MMKQHIVKVGITHGDINGIGYEVIDQDRWNRLIDLRAKHISCSTIRLAR